MLRQPVATMIALLGYMDATNAMILAIHKVFLCVLRSVVDNSTMFSKELKFLRVVGKAQCYRGDPPARLHVGRRPGPQATVGALEHVGSQWGLIDMARYPGALDHLGPGALRYKQHANHKSQTMGDYHRVLVSMSQKRPFVTQKVSRTYTMNGNMLIERQSEKWQCRWESSSTNRGDYGVQRKCCLQVTNGLQLKSFANLRRKGNNSHKAAEHMPDDNAI